MTLPLPATDAIAFALKIDDHFDREEFLQMWTFGQWDELRDEWPEAFEDAEASFHRRRRMFCVTNKLLIAGEGDPRSHDQWIGYPVLLRGYYLDGRIVWYMRDFLPAPENDVLHYTQELVQKLYVPKDTELWNGVIVGKVGEAWKGKEFLGHVNS